MTDPGPPKRPLVSLVTPAFNEAENLPVLHRRIAELSAGQPAFDWEWLVVDDHSSDATFEVLRKLSGVDSSLRAFRLARNSGSHAAIACGLAKARGDCAIVLAADLQDPPERIPEMLAAWRSGAQIVWAERSGARPAWSSLYWMLMRHLAAVPQTPAAGADFVLLDRVAVNAVGQFAESNVSILALMTWMGFRQASITYEKEARLHGQSGWTLRKKRKLVVDSITSFSYFPIRLMAYIGFVVAFGGFLYAFLIVANAFQGHRPEGWASLMVVVLTLGGLQMLMMGVLGEYLWRALEEARARPRYLIEDTLDGAAITPQQG
jgi:polyisoprenyl-phosphate glycosyltransferase